MYKIHVLPAAANNVQMSVPAATALVSFVAVYVLMHSLAEAQLPTHPLAPTQTQPKSKTNSGFLWGVEYPLSSSYPPAPPIPFPPPQTLDKLGKYIFGGLFWGL